MGGFNLSTELVIQLHTFKRKRSFQDVVDLLHVTKRAQQLWRDLVLLPAILTQHDHTLAVDLGDDPQHRSFSAFEGHFQTNPQPTQGLQGFLFLQFINALADVLVQFQQLVDAHVLNAPERPPPV